MKDISTGPGRIEWRDNFWDGKRKGFITALVMAGLMLALLFLVNYSYIFGALFKSEERQHALNVLAVDYDHGVIGKSLSAAYINLQSKSFPSFQFHSTDEYPTIQDTRNAVCRGDFWAAVVTLPGASDRLAAALQGGEAAMEYEANNTVTYVWNAARYAAVQSSLSGYLATLVGTMGSAYHMLNGTGAVQSLNRSDSAAVLAFTDPIQASSINIMPTTQGPRVLYNTIGIVLPAIQQFFFVMALNGINNNHGIYGRLKSSRVGFMRCIISLVYALIASLVISGVIWAFRGDWGVDGGQFALTWMIYWLLMHVHFGILDAVTAFIPPSFLAFFVLTWVIVNVSSTIYPFELSAGWYRIGYALPGYNTYSILVQIWSGCNNQLSRALPILFAWDVLGIFLGTMGMFYRNKKARAEIKEIEKIIEDRSGSRETIVVEEEATDAMERITLRAGGPSFPMPFLQNRTSRADIGRT